MEYKQLGLSDVTVSSISMGCWPIVGDAIWGAQDKSEAIAALKTAVDCGINFFDSAEGYGNGYSEELIGEGLADVRSKIIIASKVSPAHLAAADLRASCETSLKRLRTDYIDVYYIHWPSHTIPMAETMRTMEELKAEGKIRVIAGSNFGIGDLEEITKHGRIEVNELPYNLIWRTIEDEIMPACARRKISVTAYMPLMQGMLAGKYQSAADVPDSRARTRHFSSQRAQTRHGEAGAEEETFDAITKIRAICDGAGIPMAQAALSWVLHQPNIASVIVGLRNPDQVRANVAAADVRLSSSVLRALGEATDPLKKILGPNPDLWQAGPNCRYR
jgi:aryl-alcohol dehydrogenase-like predicted oxidoreductase